MLEAAGRGARCIDPVYICVRGRRRAGSARCPCRALLRWRWCAQPVAFTFYLTRSWNGSTVSLRGGQQRVCFCFGPTISNGEALQMAATGLGKTELITWTPTECAALSDVTFSIPLVCFYLLMGAIRASGKEDR